MTTSTSVPTPATVRKSGAWIALLIAGGFEVGYALSVNGSVGFTQPLWSAIAVAFFLATLFFLSVALKKIDVGIGYAVWAGIGAVGAAVLGPVFFDETLTPTKGFWLAVIIAGVIWLKLADSPKAPPSDTDGPPAPGPAGITMMAAPPRSAPSMEQPHVAPWRDPNSKTHAWNR
ncbi:DMT family transporter [Enemella sp. A6]|uniref:DMT family transporter n=1 Tax=Enemella sp. A6 TaxID=3440152 RepID=UPI003EC10AB9